MQLLSLPTRTNKRHSGAKPASLFSQPTLQHLASLSQFRARAPSSHQTTSSKSKQKVRNWFQMAMAGPQWPTSEDARTREGPQDPRPPPESTPKQSLGPRAAQLPTRPSLPSALEGWRMERGTKGGGREGSPSVQVTAERAGKERGPAGCWRTSPRPGAPAPNGGDRGSEPHQAASGRPGPRRPRHWATLLSRLPTPGEEGP